MKMNLKAIIRFNMGVQDSVTCMYNKVKGILGDADIIKYFQDEICYFCYVNGKFNIKHKENNQWYLDCVIYDKLNSSNYLSITQEEIQKVIDEVKEKFSTLKNINYKPEIVVYQWKDGIDEPTTW